ncbi:HpcH/HpaI aldolase/citrate lyase family protein [Jannaschia formosa]|uniref:HpcH/HpaI aldolase/citrate lyase family protein n=1 Tax=Jannaschia formosa TaxID=2259592 RepID=UPI000E1BBD00|nr:CoA ester lyase [Jannaschia formosa]TFL19206.1 CoA ester lyase [Jannaschia formosa]
MTEPARPYRSVLYIPASKERALEKAAGLPVDAIIFDLEDAVAPTEKAAAREALGRALARIAYGPRARIIRVNGADTEWGADDLAAACGMEAEAVLLPKVAGPEDIAAAVRVLEAAGSGMRVWAMIESPAGVLNAAAIARALRLGGLVLGTNDLAKDLGVRDRADRMPLLHCLSATVLAARAAGVPCIDGVYNAFRDEEGLRAECEQGRDLGMDGKTLIHPAQVAIANAAFAPTEAEIAQAQAVIAAHEAALAEGQGVAVLDGKIVENLHVETARKTLARQAAIEELEG